MKTYPSLGRNVSACLCLTAALSFSGVLAKAADFAFLEARQSHPVDLQGSVLLAVNSPAGPTKEGKNQVTSQPALKLSGRDHHPSHFPSRKTRIVRVNGSSWASTITGLEFGKNTIWITPVSKYGTAFPAQRLKITRK